MKKLLIALAAVLALILVILVVAPFLIPTETYKAQIAEAARQATGRELRLGGDIRLSLLPRLELEAEDVALANAPGASRPDMASLDKLVLRLQVWPLVSGEVKVDRFVLVRPEIHLEIDEDGRSNWEFGTAPAGAPAQAQEEGALAPPEAAPRRAGAPALHQVSLGDMRLEDGLVTFRDARTGDAYQASEIAMTVSLPDLEGPVRADGSLVWNGQKLSLELASENLRGLMAGQPTPLDLALASQPINLGFKGSLANAQPRRLEGRIDLDVPSVRALAAWAGQPIEAAGEGFGPLRIQGRLEASDTTFAFTEAAIALDGMNATGDLTADTGGARPALKGRLEVDRIDANVYLPPPAEDAGAQTGAGGQAGPEAQGAPAGWSEEPISFDGLKAADVDFALTVGAIRVQELEIGRSALTATLKDGLIVLDLSELALYGGQGQGRLTLDGRGAVPAMAKSFTLQGIQAEPFLVDAAEFDRLEGTGDMEVEVAARGRSQKDMVEALDGQGAVKFTDGAIKGINLAAMVRNVQSAFLDAGAGEVQKTDFAELSGTFRIDKGILRNDDLLLLNPLLRLTGKGTADLPRRTVAYRVEPKVVAALEGQGGVAGTKGIAVPVIIEGPWHDLTYRPDLAGLATDVVRDPSKALEGAKDTIQQLEEGAAGGLGKALEGMAQPPPGEEGEATGGGQLPDPGKALKGLFGN